LASGYDSIVNLDRSVEAIEKIIEYQFKDTDILIQALTHSSYFNEAAELASSDELRSDNERLEFLGDAVLGLVVAKELMSYCPSANEGRLSRWRSSLVSRKTLAELALDLGLREFLLLGRGERQTGGAEKRSILAAVFEAIVGAIYLDGGMEPVHRFLKKVFTPFLASLADGNETCLRMVDKKTHLQEKTQSIYKSAPSYRLVEAWGPEHEKVFRVEILIEGKVVATGDGRSKKEAEQDAAHNALESLGISSL
jgi:ribonuclease III